MALFTVTYIKNGKAYHKNMTASSKEDAASKIRRQVSGALVTDVLRIA